jgi:hypothetical protein
VRLYVVGVSGKWYPPEIGVIDVNVDSAVSVVAGVFVFDHQDILSQRVV